MHPSINTTRKAAYAQMQEKHVFYIKYLASHPKIAKELLRGMNNIIKRDSVGRVARNSIKTYERMEKFRTELNLERLRVKNEQK